MVLIRFPAICLFIHWSILFADLFFHLFIYFFFFIHFIVRLSRRHKLTRIYPPPSQKLICTPLCLLSNRTGNHFLRGSLINLVPQKSPLLKPFDLPVCLQTRESTDRIWSPIGFSGSGISRIWSKLEIRDFKARSRFGIESMCGRWDSRATLEIMRDFTKLQVGITGLKNPIGNLQRSVLPTKNPGGTLTYHTSKASNWRNKADLFILSGGLTW